jgi:hypothetical protein
MNLLWLLTAHHIADVAYQPSWLIKNKHHHWWSVYEHSFVWAGVISIALYLLGVFEPWKFIFLLVGHFVIDWYRYRYLHNWNWIYLDQALHYLQVIIVL